jgi:hypothetical protein
MQAMGAQDLEQTEVSTMAMTPATADAPRSFDERGRAVRLTEEEVREENARALAALDAIAQIGEDAEQRETLEYLMRVVDEDRLSDRPRFGSRGSSSSTRGSWDC